MSNWGALLCLLALHQGSVAPPQVSLLSVDTRPGAVRTGDAFHLVLRIRASAGVRVAFPDSLSRGEGFGARGPGVVRRLSPEIRDGGTGRGFTEEAASDVDYEVTYPLQWLRPGIHTLPPLRIRTEVVPDGVERGSGGGGHRTDGEPGTGWRLISLGSVEILPVLPQDGEDLEPAPPVLLPARSGPLPLGTMAMAGVLGTLVFGAAQRRKKRRMPSGRVLGKASSHGPPVPSPSEASARLRAILREDLGPSAGEARWEEALLLLRILALPAEGSRAVTWTSTEILSARALDNRGLTGLLRAILKEGDGMRFAGKAVSEERARALLVRVREWMEENGD